MAEREPERKLEAEAEREPWMRESHPELHPVLAAVVCSFQHAREDLAQWTEGLSDDELAAQPLGLGSVAFHIRHIAGSVDRLTTYARGAQLSAPQLAALHEESRRAESRVELFAAFEGNLRAAETAIRAIDPRAFEEIREIGRQRIPVRLATLLVHIAEHTQRHVGAAIVTAKVLRAMRVHEYGTNVFK